MCGSPILGQNSFYVCGTVAGVCGWCDQDHVMTPALLSYLFTAVPNGHATMQLPLGGKESFAFVEKCFSLAINTTIRILGDIYHRRPSDDSGKPGEAREGAVAVKAVSCCHHQHTTANTRIGQWRSRTNTCTSFSMEDWRGSNNTLSSL